MHLSKLVLLYCLIVFGFYTTVVHSIESLPHFSEPIDEIVVTGEQVNEKNLSNVGKTIKTAKQIAREQSQSVKDLVRHEVGISVVESGRFGQSGFSVRGLDENRVAIHIDGLAQAETISSQGFKELFEGYGNFNNIRNTAEVETLRQVEIYKGANSLKTGSGALGGAVIFETKDPRDYLLDKNYYASYKYGYNTVDDQTLNTFTAVARYNAFDGMVIYTNRDGHEVKNYGYKHYNDKVQGKIREKADPYRHTLESTLLKFAFQPSDSYRFNIMIDQYNSQSKGRDLSYTLKQNTQYMTYDEMELRHTHDQIKRKNYVFSYENFSENIFWDTLKLTYSQQSIKTQARTDDYCDGNDQCPTSHNPLRMQYNKDNQLIGEDGLIAHYVNTPAKVKTVPINVPVEAYNGTNSIYRWQRAKWKELEAQYPNVKYSKSCNHEFNYWGNSPSIGDTSSCEVELAIPVQQQEHSFEIGGIKHNLLEETNLITDEQILPTHLPLTLSCEGLNCDKTNLIGFERNGNPVAIPFNVIEREGKKYAQTVAQGGTQLTSPIIFVPNKLGYQSNLWTQRELTSHTHQINVDLTKEVGWASTQHQLFYGALWSEMSKKMVNVSGDKAINVKWWANYPNDCSQTVGNIDRYSSLCFNQNTYSFLIPVTTKTGSFYVIDEISLTDSIKLGAGYRYDHIRYLPKYKPGVTPRIPADMVTNLYLDEPKFDAFDLDDPQNLARKEANANANIQHIAQAKTFSANSYSFDITLNPLEWLQIQGKYSKAFRTPTSDEIYFTFKHPDFSVLPNKNLKAETAKNKELALTLYNRLGQITTSVFEIQYENFIDLAFIGNKQLQGHTVLIPFSVYQNINRQSAKVTGVEINAKLRLGELLNQFQGLNIGYQYAYQKGRINHTIPMNAIQPKTSVFSMSYQDPQDQFGIDLYLTHVEEKKGKDTYNLYYKEQLQKNSEIKWRNANYTVMDLMFYIKPIKYFTLQAGIYNVTNRKYITWESARSIRPFGTTNMIDQKTGLGLNRFTSPARNYRFSVQFEF